MNFKKKPIIFLFLLSLSSFVFAQQPTRDFSKETARPTADWVKDAVIYQIFERQYSQKGDFNSITADLDRLKNLGVDVLWLMPIHPIGKLKSKGTIGSPYAVKDYYAINPDYGTKEDFKRLISEAHKRNLKVIIDIVANHTSWDSVMMKNPAFYTHNDKGEIIPPVPDWADVADLNYNNRGIAKIYDRNARFLDSRLRFGRFSLRCRVFCADGFLGKCADAKLIKSSRTHSGSPKRKRRICCRKHSIWIIRGRIIR